MLNAIKTFEQYRSIPKIDELNSVDFSIEDVKKSNFRDGYFESFSTPRYSNENN